MEKSRPGLVQSSKQDKEIRRGRATESPEKENGNFNFACCDREVMVRR